MTNKQFRLLTKGDYIVNVVINQIGLVTSLSKIEDKYTLEYINLEGESFFCTDCGYIRPAVADEVQHFKNHQEPTQVKLDSGKLRYDLMPFDALDEVAKVLTYGIKKYPKPEENWRVNSTKKDIKRYMAAMLRHISELKQDRPFDSESGMHHLAHIATNSLFMIALCKQYGVEFPDFKDPTRDKVGTK
jgi:hypothetical protein